MKVKMLIDAGGDWPPAGQTCEVSDEVGNALIQNRKALEVIEVVLKRHRPIETAMIVAREDTAMRVEKPKPKAG